MVIFSRISTISSLPVVKSVAPKILAPLATGAVSALGSLGIDKLFGKGVQTRGAFQIP